MQRRIVLVIEPAAQKAIDAIELAAAKDRSSAILLRSIHGKLALLKQNPLAGTKIPRQQIPKTMRCDNLWKMDLAGYWRMLYTLSTQEIEIVSIVLEISDHQSYDKRFGYRRR